MKGNMIADWKKAEFGTSEGSRQFLEAVQYFMSRPRVAADEIRARIAEFTVPGDFPADAVEAIARFHQVDDPDTGWMEVFDVIDFTGTRKNSFDLIDVSSGLSFRAVKPGEKAQVYKVSGDKVSVDFDLYGGALGWSKLWFDDEEYWKIEDAAKEFRARWYMNQAQSHYDLISGARADSDVAWQGTEDDDTAVRDAATINQACADILADMQGLGFDVNANSTFVVVSPVQLLSRLRNALRVALLGNSAVTGDLGEVNFNVKLVVTTRLKNQALTAAETAQYFVALPGRKIKSGNRMDLTILSETDVLAYAETVAGWGRYGALVGEQKQLRRCATS
ncbi:MAG TPA: hypothetical protein VM658_14575 [bacterium]|nr:hypothetical protein [bacterium]